MMIIVIDYGESKKYLDMNLQVNNLYFNSTLLISNTLKALF